MIGEDGVRPLSGLLSAVRRLGDLALDEESEIRVLEPGYVYVRVHRRLTEGGEAGGWGRSRSLFLDMSGVRPKTGHEDVQFSSIQFGECTMDYY